MKTGYMEWSILCVWLTGSGSQKTSDVVDHAILSIVIAYSVINDYM